ncbi:MAG TPA: hypothetical protein VNH22_18455 [Blastocatellia bacterium]|jgi:hydrogenase maturation protease|nr:hypothetical protein [Blastocatellia bacterium]
MNLGLVEKIASAVLYEGYILYPYRASAVKNRQRWNFGALYPRAFSLAQGLPGVDACAMQTECLALASPGAAVDVRVRFLHLVAREVGELLHPSPGPQAAEEPLAGLKEGTDYRGVPMLDIGGQIFQTWQEASEREVTIPGLDLDGLAAGPSKQDFAFPAGREVEPLLDEGRLAGVLVRRQQAIEGSVEVAAERAGERLFKISVRISNQTSLEGEYLGSRDEALMRSLVSTHTVLTIRDGEFVSLLEPPDSMREIAASCVNTGTWPVLVGNAGERDCLLSSPIILYDYPQIAPESAGDLFDSTEIDEILTLRIMTLTDEEKREMRGVDARARRILERTESLPPEQMMKLHATMRSPGPVKEDER